jgi:O-antigen/teichoic acid export membrane protein
MATWAPVLVGSETCMKSTTDFFKTVAGALRHPMTGEAGVLTVLQYSAIGIGLITAVVAARLLGPARYGSAALLIAYPSLVWSFMSVKSVSVSMRYIANFQAAGEYDRLRGMCKFGYSLDVGSALAALAIVGASSSWVTREMLHMPGKAWSAVAYAASLPFLSLGGTSWAVLSSVRRFGLLGSMQVFQSLLTLVLVIGLLAAGLGTTGLVLANALGNVGGGLVMVGVATFALHKRGMGLWWKESIRVVGFLRRELSAFLGWNYLSVTFGGVINQVPLLLLGRFRGPSEAGYYRIATSIANASSAFEGSLGKVTYPVLSTRWAEGTIENFKATLRRWRVQGGLPLGIVFLASIPLLPFLVPFVFGDAYRPMVFGTQVMIVGVSVSVVFFYLAPAYYAVGKIGFWAKRNILYALLVVGIGWPVTLKWGFSGMATVVGLGNAVFNLLMAYHLAVWWKPRLTETT